MLKDFARGTDIAMGEAFDPTPENIEARVIRATLPSGMQLVMLRRRRGGAPSWPGGLRWATSDQGESRHRVLGGERELSRGTAKRTREQVRDELDRLRANVSVSTEGASIDTVRANLPGALALVAEMLREPAFRRRSSTRSSRRRSPASTCSGPTAGARQPATAGT